MLENCFPKQVHVAEERRTGQRQAAVCEPSRWSEGLRAGRRCDQISLGLKSSHERWGNGAGLEELASALGSDMGDGAASQVQQSLFTSDHILTPPLFPPPVRGCDLYFSHLSGTMQLFPHAFPIFLLQL